MLPSIVDPNEDGGSNDHERSALRRLLGILQVQHCVPVMLFDKMGARANGFKVQGQQGGVFYCDLHKHWEVIVNLPVEPVQLQQGRSMTLEVPAGVLCKPRNR